MYLLRSNSKFTFPLALRNHSGKDLNYTERLNIKNMSVPPNSYQPTSPISKHPHQLPTSNR
jgi:hypothetical protein